MVRKPKKRKNRRYTVPMFCQECKAETIHIVELDDEVYETGAITEDDEQPMPPGWFVYYYGICTTCWDTNPRKTKAYGYKVTSETWNDFTLSKCN